MGPLARGLSNLIGFGTEAYSAAKKSRSPSPANGRPVTNGYSQQPGQFSLAPPSYDEIRRQDVSDDDEDSYDEDDDDIWVLQETQEQLTSPQDPNAQQSETIDNIISRFEAAHPPPSYGETFPQLPMPVVIPQKRPESKMRGWVRAYAPVMEGTGIDQTTFMDFLDGFDKAIKLSPLFHAVNLAVAIAVLSTTIAVGPMLVVHLAALTAHTSIEAGRRLYNSSVTNKYLDSMNEKLFKPHGLYAMIMTYTPDPSGQISSTIDMNANILNSVNTRTNKSGKWTANFHSSSGKSVGDDMIPECAPLIFPTMEAATEEQKKNAFKNAGLFVRDYADRRSQAKFAHENPDSKLNVQEAPQFASRFADPAHPINSRDASLLNVLSGGKIPGRKARRRARTGRPLVLDGRRERKTNGRTPISAVKRKLKEKVLYLMIVNMPTEAEMREAAEMMEQAKQNGEA